MQEQTVAVAGNLLGMYNVPPVVTKTIKSKSEYVTITLNTHTGKYSVNLSRSETSEGATNSKSLIKEVDTFEEAQKLVENF